MNPPSHGGHEGDEEGVAVAPELKTLPVLHDAVHLERHLEIDLHLRRRLQYAIGDRVVTTNAAVARTNSDVQIVERRIPPRSARTVASAQRVGMGEHFRRALSRECDWRDDENEARDESAHCCRQHDYPGERDDEGFAAESRERCIAAEFTESTE
jgi:hypothetical protein